MGTQVTVRLTLPAVGMNPAGGVTMSVNPGGSAVTLASNESLFELVVHSCTHALGNLGGCSVMHAGITSHSNPALCMTSVSSNLQNKVSQELSAAKPNMKTTGEKQAMSQK